MTKRHLESLPKEQQDDILGLPPGEWGYSEYETVPQIFCKPEEWDDSAENEPTNTLVNCVECDEVWPESELDQDGKCPDCTLNNEDEQ